ncbi:MAG: DUF3147 family protein [Sphingomonadales bacterium]|nr:DUF3147 family protein [Sphingomonadales bacterium]
MELAIRALLSGFLVATIALIARKARDLGIDCFYPLVSTLGMIWLWRDTGDPKLVADYVYSAFWYFLPSIPMFLLIPWMLRSGHGFWLTLSAGITLTFILYLLTIGIAARFGVRL